MNDAHRVLKMIEFLKAILLRKNQINLRKSEKCMRVIKQVCKMTESKGINLHYKQCIKYCIFVQRLYIRTRLFRYLFFWNKSLYMYFAFVYSHYSRVCSIEKKL